MAITRVRSRVHLQMLVCKQAIEHSDPGDFAPLEDREQQWVQKHDCIVNWCDKNDLDWRWETAIAILCSGSAETTGSYLGDILGGQYV
jgi:hypothetical protein